jgi:hypothetical protein
MSHFSATRTLSDFPLLIGEMLRRGNLRSRRQARRRTLIRKIKPSEFRRPRQTKNSFLDVRKTALANRTDEVPDELALIQSERISTQWTNELRKNIRVYPTCNILKATLSLDLYMQTVVYEFFIKGWSSSRIAEHLDAALIKIQETLENAENQLKRKLVEPHYYGTPNAFMGVPPCIGPRSRAGRPCHTAAASGLGKINFPDCSTNGIFRVNKVPLRLPVHVRATTGVRNRKPASN